MSLSFEDSLKNIATNNIATTKNKNIVAPAVMSVEDMSLDSPSIMTLDESYGVAAYSGDDGNWEPISGYKRYSVFSDDNVSIINGTKDIELDGKQFNITQEENSQYIPFEMPRYYDGFDLAETTISIHYETSTEYHGESLPINVSCSDGGGDRSKAKIRFGWLIPAEATQAVGKLKFEIHARGTIVGSQDENGNPLVYVWKTKYNESLNVLQSLCTTDCLDGRINIDDSWVQELVTAVAENVANQITSSQVAVAAEKVVANALSSYSTTSEMESYVTKQIEDADIEGKLTEYAKTQDVEALVEEINASIADVVKDVSDLSTNVSGLSDNLDILSDGVDDLSTDLDTLSDNLDILSTDVSGLSNKFGTLVDDNNSPLTVKAYVDKKVEEVDVSDQIGDLGVDDEKNPLTVKAYVDKKVSEVDVSEQLGDLGANEDGSKKTVKQYVDESVANVDVDLTGYATERYVEDKISPFSSSVSTLGITVANLQNEVNSIDKSPRKTYEATYGNVELEDGTVQDSMFTLWETEGNNEPTIKSRFKIAGGSGGAAAGNNLIISYEKDTDGKNITQYVFTKQNVDENEAVIYYGFSGTDSAGDEVSYANATWKTRKGTSGNWTTLSNTTIYPNDRIPFDISDYVSIGTCQIQLVATDESGGYASKTWTIEIADIRLESSFNDAHQQPAGQPVSFPYTPHGGTIEKEIHFILDGIELGVEKTSASGIPTFYPIPAQAHGSHLLEVYMTAKVNGKTIGLEEITDENGKVIGYNHTIKIIKDILCQDPTSAIPIIGCATPTINVTQYNTVNIKYAVLDPSTETPKVTWSINGEVVSEETLTEKDDYGYYTYPYKANEAGTFVLTISCGEAEPKVITVNVEKLNIDVSPVTAGLEFDFNPVGHSNSSSDRLWSYNDDIKMTVSPDFDWVNGGYQIDENGDQYFCVKAGTKAFISYNLFADDPKKNGKEFKVIFRTKNIRKRDTSFLTCLNDGIGLDMKVENATIYNSSGLLKSDYCEDTIIEYEFNINKDTDMMIVMSYEDGAPSKPYEYTETSSFKQSSPQPITIGSEDCDIHIYRMKAYSTSLTDTDIKNNFIADARNADEIIARYNRNQIYTDGKLISTSASGDFNVDALMKAAPDLRYIFLEVPQFTNDKDNKIDGCTVYFRYPAGTRPQDNWTCTGMRHRGQGTSSNLYGYSGRNIDLCMDRDESLFTYVDEEGNTVESSTITLTDTSVPTDYLNIKVNIASSENANNAGMASRFNEYQPFLRYARKKDKNVKDTMEFHNCVVFIRETSTDLSNTPHREFNDTDWHKKA